jgi:signal peptide peptidase SppA
MAAVPNPNAGIAEADRRTPGVVRMVGIMTKYSSWCDDIVGFIACETIADQLRADVADQGVERVKLVIDSPGGTIAGSTELAELVALLGRVKPIDAVVSDTCCSSAYYVASQCASISANAHATIGSIGIYAVLLDTSAADAEAGLSFTLVSSGEAKGLGADGRVTPELVAKVSESVIAHADLFAAAVARGRKLKPRTVRALADGSDFIAADALAYGLIDRIELADTSIVRGVGSPGAKPSAGPSADSRSFLQLIGAKAPTARS